MDDQIIFVDLRIKKIGDTNVSYVKERIWRPLVSFNSWVLKRGEIPGVAADGLGITLITNAAIIIEGIIGDILDEHYYNSNQENDSNLESKNWEKKKSDYNSLFTKRLELYQNYKSIAIIFSFRNNLAHGLANIEKTASHAGENQKSQQVSVNEKYRSIRKYFIKNGFISNEETPVNNNQLWKLKNAWFLWQEAKSFISDVLKENESKFNIGIIYNWEAATSGRG